MSVQSSDASQDVQGGHGPFARTFSCVLLTGGCGFIGSALVRWLLARPEGPARVVVLDALFDGGSRNNIEAPERKYGPARLRFVRGEYGDEALVDRIFREEPIDAVFHLAAETHVDRGYAQPVRCALVNVVQTVALLEVCRKYAAQLRVILVTSTDEVYGDADPRPCPEEAPLWPTNPYSASKAAVEHFVNAYHVSFGLPTVMVRCNNAIGRRQETTKVLPRFVTTLVRGAPLTIHGAGQQRRYFVHVKDVCHALFLVATRGALGHTYNVGGVAEVSIIDLARLVWRMMRAKGLVAPCMADSASKDDSSDKAPPVVFVADRPYNDAFYRVDDSKIRRLGWRPCVSFEDALDDTITWYAARAREGDRDAAPRCGGPARVEGDNSGAGECSPALSV